MKNQGLMRILLATLIGIAMLATGCENVDGPIEKPKAPVIMYKFDGKYWEPVQDREIIVESTPEVFELRFKSFGFLEVKLESADNLCTAEIMDAIEIDENGVVVTEPHEVQQTGQGDNKYYFQRVRIDMRSEKEAVLVFSPRLEPSCRTTLIRK